MNPRNGIDFDKPAAPARLTAFIEGVRRRNSALLADSVAGSRWLEAAHSSGDLFSDLAVQVHYGDPIGEDVLARGGGWHVDGPNSTLHMGISLHGERKLHVELTEPGESPCEIRERGCDGKWPDG